MIQKQDGKNLGNSSAATLIVVRLADCMLGKNLQKLPVFLPSLQFQSPIKPSKPVQKKMISL